MSHGCSICFLFGVTTCNLNSHLNIPSQRYFVARTVNNNWYYCWSFANLEYELRNASSLFSSPSNSNLNQRHWLFSNNFAVSDTKYSSLIFLAIQFGFVCNFDEELLPTFPQTNQKWRSKYLLVKNSVLSTNRFLAFEFSITVLDWALWILPIANIITLACANAPKNSLHACGLTHRHPQEVNNSDSLRTHCSSSWLISSRRESLLINSNSRSASLFWYKKLILYSENFE